MRSIASCSRHRSLFAALLVTLATAASPPTEAKSAHARTVAVDIARADGPAALGALLERGRRGATRLRGERDAVRAVADGRAVPVSLATGDFDEDGVADLACGYDWLGRGAVALFRARPTAPGTRDDDATFAPFRRDAEVMAIEAAPVLLVAGDFDADGHLDLVFAEPDASRLCFAAGTGHGQFDRSRAVALPGPLTALVAGEIGRADGLPDLGVCVGGGVPRVLVLAGPRGAVAASPLSIDLVAPVESAAVARLGRDTQGSLVAAAGGAVVVVRDSGGGLSLDVAADDLDAVAVATGRFVGSQTEIGALGADGSVTMLSRVSGEWTTVRTTAVAPPGPRARLEVARISSDARDGLVMLDPSAGALGAIASLATVPLGRTTPANAVAAVGMRLDADAFDDLVVLETGSAVPTVMRSRGGPVFVVTTTADDGPGSLRKAIFDAGAADGVDTIMFAIPGAGPHTIAVQTALPSLLDPMTIDGTTQPGYAGTPLVEIDNAAVRDGIGFDVAVGGVVIRGLAITNADGSGVSIFGEGGSFVEASFLGLGPSGTAKPNALDGVTITTSVENTIGGTSPSARNVISGNAASGVHVADGSDGNRVVGNYIGLNAAGAAAVPNAGDGVNVSDATATEIGGTATGARNVVAGNGALGIGVFDAGTTGTLVLGNYVGTNAAGSTAVPNGADGVLVQDAPANSVGGTSSGAGNLVSGNLLNGVAVIGTGTAGTVVCGNTIGTNAAGTQKIPNLGNGVYMEGASDTLVGGATAAAANIISGNDSLGVGLFKGTSGARIQGNTIGLGANDVQLGNFADGVYIQDSSDNLVGGSNPGEGNTIAANGASGILVFSGVRNSILGNSFFDNGWIGIDVDEPGIAVNDEGDTDGGANGGLNHPVLTWASAVSGGTNVRGRVDSMPGQTYRLEFFSSDDCDPFGVGEGQRFLGALDVATDASGSVLFDTVVPTAVAIGAVVTATATDADGNTSEFSECSVVLLSWDPPAASGGPPQNLTISAAAASAAPAQASARADVTAYKVYRSPSSPVPVSSATLFTTVPPTQTTANAPASAGGFFTVTACYSDGTESAGSNDVGTPGAPVLTSVTLKGASKLVATGSNITSGVLVIVDGIPFVSPAKLKKQGTQVVQKGSLIIQQTVRQYLASRSPGPDGRREVLVGVRNSSGAVTTFLLSE